MVLTDTDEVQLPDIEPVAGARPRSRRLRGTRRVRALLGFGLLAVAGTLFLASPLGVAVRVQTQELLSNVVGEVAEAPTPIAVPGEADVLQASVPAIDFDDSVFVDPRMVGLQPPWALEGLLTFRGSPTRSFYGRGPIPEDPDVQWRFPEEGGLCRQSTVGAETRTWCGTGWTGQPALFRLDGLLWSCLLYTSDAADE